MSAMYAARFPENVSSLVIAGTPIDTDAGNGPVKRMAHTFPIGFYEDLVKLGGGLMRGEIMLHGWKNMHLQAMCNCSKKTALRRAPSSVGRRLNLKPKTYALSSLPNFENNSVAARRASEALNRCSVAADVVVSREL